MHVILEAVEGPARGTRLAVRLGQIVRVGRTEWADFSLPADPELSEVHFQLECKPEGCLLQAQAGAEIAVNGEPATEVLLRPGDKVTAGQTTFVALLPEGFATAQGQLPAGETGTGVEAKDLGGESVLPEKPFTAADYCQRIELSEEATGLLADELPPGEYLERLTAEELYADALKFVACWLPKPDAVRWGCGCLQALFEGSLPETDTDALEAALAWAEDPTEENRRAAEAAAKRSDSGEAATWLALAAFWSGGSLSAPELPEVPPAEGLTAQGIAGALVMAAPHGDPSQTETRYRDFLERGKESLANIKAVSGD